METGVEREKVIFFGNGPLAEAVLGVLTENAEIEVIFRARTREDLEEVKRLRRENPTAHGILASYGVLIKEDVLELFEPEGILNVHPSLLPKYRGASPIESAILAGDTEFGISVMKLARGMDAGPIYWQGMVPEVGILRLTEARLTEARSAEANSEKIGTQRADLAEGGESDEKKLKKAVLDMKLAIYRGLAEAGARWISENLRNLPEPQAQNEAEATFTEKISKEMGTINPATETAEGILRKIIAFQGFPKVKYAFFSQNCIILAAHIAEQGERAVLTIPCLRGEILAVDRLQPEGRKAMDAKSFVNGYGRAKN